VSMQAARSQEVNSMEERDQALADAAFQVAERWLYNYNRWQAEAFILRDTLADHTGKVTAHLGRIGTTGEPGDGTFSRTTSVIEAEEKLPVLEAKIRILKAALDSLGDELLKVVTYKYFRAWSNQLCWEHLRLSEREFYRDRRQAVSQISQILLNGILFRMEVEEKLNRNRELVKK